MTYYGDEMTSKSLGASKSLSDQIAAAFNRCGPCRVGDHHPARLRGSCECPCTRPDRRDKDDRDVTSHKIYRLWPYAAVHDERKRAHAKHQGHGWSMEDADWDHPRWLPVVTEELGEVAKELCERDQHTEADHKRLLRDELIQLAAMTMAWIEKLEE